MFKWTCRIYLRVCGRGVFCMSLGANGTGERQRNRLITDEAIGQPMKELVAYSKKQLAILFSGLTESIGISSRSVLVVL